MKVYSPSEIARGLHVKYNRNHDRRGRFTTSSGGSGSSSAALITPPDTRMGRFLPEYIRTNREATDFINGAAQGSSLAHAEASGEARAKSAQAIGERMASDDKAWNAYIRAFMPGLAEESIKEMMGSDKATRTYYMGNQVKALVDGWATTSSDHDTTMLCLQRAVAEEFGARPQSREYVDKFADAHVDKVYSQRGEFYRSVARAMYEHTQDELGKAGIDRVTLHRGMVFPKDSVPTWAQQRDIQNGQLVVPIVSNPISSWSSSHDIARDDFADSYDKFNFKAVVLSATVPKERVFSTGRTGAGTLHEYEWLLLDTPGHAEIETV